MSTPEVKDEEQTSIIGMSVCVETMKDGEQLVGILVHTKDAENAFMIRMTSAKAKALAGNIDMAADSIDFGEHQGVGYQ